MKTLVRLSGLSDGFLAALAQGKVNLKDLVVAAALQGSAPQRTAVAVLADHVAKIVRNNPTQSMASILARPDVVQAVSQVQLAGDKVEQIAITAHALGAKAGSQATRAQASSLGLTLPPPAELSGSATLDKITERVADQASMLPHAVNAQATVAHGAANSQPAFDKITHPNPVAENAEQQASAAEEAANRAGAKTANNSAAATSFAASRGYNEAALAEIAAIKDANPDQIIRKIWISQLSFSTCPTCAALHGTVIEVDEVFNDKQSFGKPQTVFTTLDCPPRHPSCQCTVAIYVDTEEMIAYAAGARKAAQDFAAESDIAAPASWRAGSPSTVATQTDHLQSADIRAASDSQFTNAIRQFSQCWLHFG